MSTDWRTSPEVDRRVDDLLARMTLEEKVDLVTGDQDFGYAFYNAPIERVGIPALTMADGPAGARVNNTLGQRRAEHRPARADRAGRDVGTGARPNDTAMFSAPRPSPPATTCSWRRRSTSRGLRVAAGPSSRSARIRCCRRGWWFPRSTASRPIPSRPRSSTSSPTTRSTGASRSTSEVDERTLHEIYLPPFEAAIRDGGVGAAMASFNRVNGAYASEHPTLLTDVLRGRARLSRLGDERLRGHVEHRGRGECRPRPGATSRSLLGPAPRRGRDRGRGRFRDPRRDGAAHPSADDRARPRRSSG